MYIGIPPFGQTVRTVTTITATASQTIFTPNGGYTAGYVDVYYNGIKLVGGVDFTASNGLTVTLAIGATANAIVEIVSYGSVSIADAVRRSGDTFAGTVNFPNNNIIAANGYVGIGNTVPNAPLVIGSASGSFTNPLVQAAGNANSWIQINGQNLNNGNNASTDLVLARSDGNDTAGFIDVGINSNTYAQAAYSIMTPRSGYVFTNGGDLIMGAQTNNNIIFHTGNTTAASERLRIDAAALSLTGLQGIKFPVTQSASSDSNTLDDYEEGTWTPSDASGAALPITVNSSGSRNRYTKIGNLVYLTASLSWPTTSNSAQARLTIPFAQLISGFYSGGGYVTYSDRAPTKSYIISTENGVSGGGSQTFVIYDGAILVTNADLSGRRIDIQIQYLAA